MATIKTLRNKIAIASTVVLTVLLTIVGIAVISAYNTQLRHKVYLRLDSMMLDLTRAVTYESPGKLSVNTGILDRRLNTDSGFYALVTKNDKVLWRSKFTPKDFNVKIELQLSQALNEIANINGELVYTLVSAVDITGDSLDEPYIFVVGESERVFYLEAEEFRNNLLIGLVVAGLLIFMLEAFFVKYGLSSLKVVVKEIDQIKNDRQLFLSEDYPLEISSLTKLVNSLLVKERENKERYKNSLADLAHSIKTPLAIMRNEIMSKGSEYDIHVLSEAINNISKIIEYQLKRATYGGLGAFAKQIKIQPIIDKTLKALATVYLERKISLTKNYSNNLVFPGEVGDFTEILGNLLDNAYKWAQSEILLNITRERKGDIEQLIISVEDDGVGIDDSKIEKIMQRGQRGDNIVPGHGVGMAIVADIVKYYHGTVDILRSERLGGAHIVVSIPLQQHKQ